ncbi:MAG: redox-sensing transcriptional repressor Rex [Bacteroidales bacterium]|nr:redox-sensing transcriptional repressor Rex [Bacteroidales bacterium]
MDQDLIKKIPHKTIQRLSQYRRALLLCFEQGKTHIFSHEIANLQHITAVQVRRDLMLIGYSGNLRKGYNIKDLIELIGKIIDSPNGQKVAIFGMGNFGRAISKYFSGRRSKLTIVAGFDVSPDKVGKEIVGIPCYHMDKAREIILQEGIKIGIITVPGDQAVETAKAMVEAGMKGILNYSPTPVEVPENVFLEEYDMVTSLEKVAFYVKEH